jgi:hypothetical protein
MKKIKTTDIIVGSAMPLKSGSLDHLQSAYREDELDMIQMLIAQNDTEVNPAALPARIMYGCRFNSGTGAISIGCVVYGDEIFRAVAQTVVLGFGQVVVGNITTTYATATNYDPVIFSDGTSNNVHEIRRIVWSAGASGSGDFDLDDLLLYGQWNTIAFNSSYISSSSGTLTLPGGAADWDVKYRQEGRTIWIDYAIGPMTLAGSNATAITLSLPFNANFKSQFNNGSYYENLAGSPTKGFAIGFTISGSKDINFTLPSGVWTIGTGIQIYGQITAELEKADV